MIKWYLFSCNHCCEVCAATRKLYEGDVLKDKTGSKLYRDRNIVFLRPFMPLNEPRSLNKGATLTMDQHTIFGMRCKSREEHFPDSHSWGRARQLIGQTYVNLRRDRNRKPVKMADAGAKTAKSSENLSTHWALVDKATLGLQQVPTSILLIVWNLDVRRQLTLPVGVNSDCRLNSIKYKGMRFSKGDSNARDLDNNTTVCG